MLYRVKRRYVNGRLAVGRGHTHIESRYRSAVFNVLSRNVKPREKLCVIDFKTCYFIHFSPLRLYARFLSVHVQRDEKLRHMERSAKRGIQREKIFIGSSALGFYAVSVEDRFAVLI